MVRPTVNFPTPGKRLRGKIWYIFWRGMGRVVEVSVRECSKEDAEHMRIEVAYALRTGKWPKWAEGKRAIQRYLMESMPQNDEPLLDIYGPELRSHVSSEWASSSIKMIEELQRFAGKYLRLITPADAEAFLAHVIHTPGPRLKGRGPRGRATRNRIRLVCGRFYRWAVRTGRVRMNPFENIKPLREEDRGDIVHLTIKERDAVLDAVAGEPDELAVWLALFAGMRRGEIARCRWQDVSLDRRKIDIPRSKTRRRRAVDMEARLRDRLAQIPQKKRVGRVVPWPAAGPTWRYRAVGLIERLGQKLVDAGGKPIVAREKLGWNVFRHTFASLLVQGGASIFKVAGWLGDRLETCRRYYAAMSPDHDPDIDRLAYLCPSLSRIQSARGSVMVTCPFSQRETVVIVTSSLTAISIWVRPSDSRKALKSSEVMAVAVISSITSASCRCFPRDRNSSMTRS